jgi:hypothetical protein
MSGENYKASEATTDVSFNKIFLKAKYSFYSAVVFFIFANPETLFILQRALGKMITIITPGGMTTLAGIFITTSLFFITILGLMMLPI